MTRKNLIRLAGAVSLALVVLSVPAGAALALTDASGSVWARGCSIRYEVTVTTFDRRFFDGFRVGLTTDRTPEFGDGDWDEYTHIFVRPADGGTYTVSGSFFIEPDDREKPIHVFVGDGLPQIGFPLYRYIDTIDMSDCKGDEDPEWWFSVEDMGATDSYSYQGSLACGVFDVQGWGAKTVDLAAYPDCEGEVAVLCLDGDGQWTDGNITNLVQDGSVVTFMSSQHGTCAFFEQ